jgi:hypothetical protein
MKAARACTPRIQVHDPSTFGMARLVRVPTHDYVEFSGGRIQIKLLNVVEDVYQRRTSFGDRRHRQVRGPNAFVNVSSNRDDRCNNA